MKSYIGILAMCIPLTAFTQPADESRSALEQLSKDLTGLHDQVLNVQRTQSAARWGSFAEKIKVTTGKATIRAGASDNAQTIMTVGAGMSYPVLDKVNEWYAVNLGTNVKGFDTGWVKASESVPLLQGLRITSSPQTQTAEDPVYRTLLDGVRNLRDKYRNNPYVNVTGFSVNVGVPPSVTVSFEFKK